MIKICLFYLSSITILLAKFACANLAAKFFVVNLLNSCLVIYFKKIPRDYDQ